MFTGIVQDIGRVRALEKDGDWRVEIATALDLSATPLGASIACSGCCLTIVDKGVDWFSVQVSSETLAKTTRKGWKIGTEVNLEPSLRLGDELGGHFVFGHVDGMATLESVTGDMHSRLVKIALDSRLLPLVAVKGSVTVDGVSLTVNAVDKNGFTVMIIPHTLAQTTLGQKKAGDAVNIEIDMLARYVGRLLERQAA